MAAAENPNSRADSAWTQNAPGSLSRLTVPGGPERRRRRRASSSTCSARRPRSRSPGFLWPATRRAPRPRPQSPAAPAWPSEPDPPVKAGEAGPARGPPTTRRHSSRARRQPRSRNDDQGPARDCRPRSRDVAVCCPTPFSTTSSGGAREPYDRPMPYLVPDAGVVAAIDAPPTPAPVLGPGGRFLLLVRYESHPPVSLLAKPHLALAGVRLDPEIRGRQRTVPLTGITVIRLADGVHTEVQLPPGAVVSVPGWSPDGYRFAFTMDEPDGIAVWVGDARTAPPEPLTGLRVSDTLSGGQLDRNWPGPVEPRRGELAGASGTAVGVSRRIGCRPRRATGR